MLTKISPGCTKKQTWLGVQCWGGRQATIRDNLIFGIRKCLPTYISIKQKLNDSNV